VPEQVEERPAASDDADRPEGTGPTVLDRTGDFDAFVAARGPALLRLALLLTGDPHRAEDLVQMALARAYQHWGRVRRAGDPEAYVNRILVRQHVSWRRLRSSSEVVGLPSASASSAGDHPDVASAVTSRAAAWALLGRLPRRQRAVLVLRYYADMSDAQVAAELGCSEGTVRSQAARALAALRAVVPDLDEELLP
jgi:RNA polymerase sigma-70 factor (sigma-E family)